MDSRWIIKKQADNQLVKQLATIPGINEVLATLLVQRGIKTKEEVKDFFCPSLDKLHDPYLIKDMDKAVDRICRAIENGEKILVYGDYDVDGTTAVAVVYTFLHNLMNKKKIAFYTPDRYTEGYGISKQGIDYAADNGFSLVIALDCGIKAIDRMIYAAERKVDFIICDHHRPDNELPKAVAVLDSKRDDDNYPYKDLSGCGVGFKLVTALAQRLNKPMSSVYELLDYVAVSIAADIVPMTGENRILAYYGMWILNNMPRPGFEAILEIEKSGIKKKPKYKQFKNVEEIIQHIENNRKDIGSIFEREISISDVVFVIGPRINAAGRLKKASDSVRLLIADKKDHAKNLAKEIDDLNSERREQDNKITEEALAIIASDEKLINAKSTVVFNENWHKGVVGIVASRLTDTYFRPTIVLTKSNDLITGSARSVRNFDIYDAIESCSDLLEHFGGHTFAAGLSLKEENLPLFQERFEKYVAEHITEGELVPQVEIDTYLNLKDITESFRKTLKRFAPFGPNNESPVFMTKEVYDNGKSRAVGHDKKHIKLSVRQIDSPDFNGIAFQKGELFSRFHKNEPFSICYKIEENYWQGRVTPQLNVKDIKFDDQINDDMVKQEN